MFNPSRVAPASSPSSPHQSPPQSRPTSPLTPSSIPRFSSVDTPAGTPNSAAKPSSPGPDLEDPHDPFIPPLPLSIPDTLNLDLLTDAHATNTGLLSLSINEALTLNESVTLDESISESARFDGPLSIMPNSPAAFPNVFPTTIADGDIHFADSPPQSPSPSPRQPPSPITQIEAGTYSIHVTIHEVKDLPTTPPQHPQPVIFPSPVIFLNISNADTPFTVNTQVLPYTPSGSYNRSYHAQLPYSTPLSFTSSTLTLSVLNATAPTIPLEKLGTHTIDLIRVYSAPGHALTRRWLALSNGGFVKMSLALAGPGHAVPPSFFDVDTPEIEREQREEEMEVFTEPVVPMEVKRVRKYLVATFYELQVSGAMRETDAERRDDRRTNEHAEHAAIHAAALFARTRAASVHKCVVLAAALFAHACAAFANTIVR